MLTRLQSSVEGDGDPAEGARKGETVDDLIRERDRQVCELGKRFTAENSRERGGGRGK